MNPNIAPEGPRTPPRIKPIALRLPRGLADRIEEKSKLDGQSMNSHIVQAVRVYLGEGGTTTAARIEELESNLVDAAQALQSSGDKVAEIEGRLTTLERLARQSGADF